jgi:hypothetical protein
MKRTRRLLLSPAGSPVVQPNSSSSGDAESDQASGSNNTEEKVEQGRGGYATDGTGDDAEPQQVEGASTNTQETNTTESTGDSAEPQQSTEDYNASQKIEGSACNNTDEKIQQDGDGYNTAEKVEQGRGGYN